MRVQPREAGPVESIVGVTEHNTIPLVIATIYLIGSIACSFSYLTLLKPAFSNDIWWPNYNASGPQALLIDTFNKFLTTNSTGSIDILKPSLAIDKTYTSPLATTEIYSTYARQLILYELTTIESAIINLRRLTVSRSFWMFTQYCWIDFGQVFEYAHTEQRQERCWERYHRNAAVYMESMLRNIIWEDLIAEYGGENGIFTKGVTKWLESEPTGGIWLNMTSNALNTTSIVDEISYWKTFQLDTFQLQWHNLFQSGMLESIQIVNALGIQQEIVIKNEPESTNTWTSMVMYWMPINDLNSLVRSQQLLYYVPPMMSRMTSVKPKFDIEGKLGLYNEDYEYADQIELFRTTIGTFGTIDTFYIVPPQNLIDLYKMYLDDLFQSFQGNNDLERSFDLLPSVAMDATPPAWLHGTDTVFYGGSPLCLRGLGQSFAQDSFGFYDTCSDQAKLSIGATKYSSLFATLATKSSTSFLPCSREVARFSECITALTRLTQAVPHSSTAFDMLILAAQKSITNLNVSIMQFATIDSTWTLLRQTLVSSPEWAFFGWVMAFEWVEGRREVVSFEGDLDSIVLISAPETPQSFPTSNIPVKTATQFIYFPLVYISVLLALLAVACILGSWLCRSTVYSPNLLFLNRIVGSLWVGRPLLLLRGITAVLMLGTSQVYMTQNSSNIRSRFEFIPRTWMEAALVSGEATWVVYVVNDLLTLFTAHSLTVNYAPISCFLAWLALTTIEVQSPLYPVLNLNRTCTLRNMNVAVQCSSGILHIGSLERVRLVVVTMGLSILIGLMLAWLRLLRRQSTCEQDNGMNRHLLGIGDAFLALANHIEGECWYMDNISCLMAGIVSLSWHGYSYTFDLKLWSFQQNRSFTTQLRTFQFHRKSVTSTTECEDSVPKAKKKSVPKKSLRHIILGIFGAANGVGAVLSSISYLQVSTVNIANDMFWPTFNISATHVFIANYLNRQLLLGVDQTSLMLDEPSVVHQGTLDVLAAVVISASNYGSLLQYTKLNAIDQAIQGLRVSDSCSAPWIFTQYCYVDFAQQWELANSATRQLRCKNMRENGAVFFESVLRNVDFNVFYDCWGDAFDIAIANELGRSNLGRKWLDMMAKMEKLTLAMEGALWKSIGIKHFTTQWQNFKQIGLTDTYAVRNAYGASFSFTLQYQSAGFRLAKQSTMKMYWGLANDFHAVQENGTGLLEGRSLVRSSPIYAYANTTLENVLLLNGTLRSPLGISFTLVEQGLGPFGSVDMYVVPCPVETKRAIHRALQYLDELRSINATIQKEFYELPDPSKQILPVPQTWSDMGFTSLGGSPLCPEIPYYKSDPVYLGMSAFVSWSMACMPITLQTNVFPSREIMLVSLLFANMTNVTMDDIYSICYLNWNYYTECVDTMNRSTTFTALYLSNYPFDSFLHDAIQVIDDLNIELFQYGQMYWDSDVEIYRINILPKDDHYFHIYSWNFLIEWALGHREVIYFHGDHGNMTLLGETIRPLEQDINTSEMPTNFALYMRSAVLYVTFSMLFLFGIVFLYSIVCYGNVEMLNFFQLQRVGAVVWVGRPLLFLRSLTAVGLLSTSNLQLLYNGYDTKFYSIIDPWYKTLLAANEVTWMVTIVNDIAMAITQEYTSKYAGWDSLLVWFISAILTIQIPAIIPLCTSGSITIGSVTRLWTLASVVLGSNLICYLITKRYTRPKHIKINSIFLYGGAAHLFYRSRWIAHDMYYMDRMSAVLNGILTIRYGNTIYGLDVKLWHTFESQVPSLADIQSIGTHLQYNVLPIGYLVHPLDTIITVLHRPVKLDSKTTS